MANCRLLKIFSRYWEIKIKHKIKPNFKKDSLIYIPQKLNLDGLKEIWLSQYALQKKHLLDEAFGKYNPKYFQLTE